MQINSGGKPGFLVFGVLVLLTLVLVVVELPVLVASVLSPFTDSLVNVKLRVFGVWVTFILSRLFEATSLEFGFGFAVMVNAGGAFGTVFTFEIVTALFAVVTVFPLAKSIATDCVVVFGGKICEMLTGRGGILS